MKAVHLQQSTEIHRDCSDFALPMTPHTVKRQPISCENCRNRKIKCTGGRAPCESCVRRGFGGSCYFVRSGGPLRDSALYDDLVDRIASLESLLRQHIDEDIACHRNTIPLTPTGVSSDASSSPNISAYAATDASLPPSSSFPLTGSLLKSPGGYVRFIPHTESFNSEDIAAFMQVESPSSPTSTAAFPFSVESTVSRQALLELLPSNRQCDELMQRFFTVFSPVSCFTRVLVFADSDNSCFTFSMIPRCELNTPNSASLLVKSHWRSWHYFSSFSLLPF